MCGIVGVVAKEPVNQLLYDGLLVLQHRGQDAAGIVTAEGPTFHMHKGPGMVRDVFRTFVDHGVLFTIATDGPEMMRTHLRDEFDLLLRIGALTQEELEEANARGHEASFVGGAHAARPNTPVGR